MDRLMWKFYMYQPSSNRKIIRESYIPPEMETGSKEFYQLIIDIEKDNYYQIIFDNKVFLFFISLLGKHGYKKIKEISIQDRNNKEHILKTLIKNGDISLNLDTAKVLKNDYEIKDITLVDNENNYYTIYRNGIVETISLNTNILSTIEITNELLKDDFSYFWE